MAVPLEKDEGSFALEEYAVYSVPVVAQLLHKTKSDTITHDFMCFIVFPDVLG